MKPFIDQCFWSDPDIEASKAGVKLAALWLITNSQTTLLGICGTSISRFKFETGLPSEALQSALEALPKSFIKIGDSIFVKNYIRHQFGSGEKLTRNNFFRALKSLFISIKDKELRDEVLKEYPEFLQALPEGLPRAYQAQGKERIGKVRTDKDKEVVGEKGRCSADAATAYVLTLGLPKTDGEWFFEKCIGAGWKNNGKPIADWQGTIRAWKLAGYLPSQKVNGKPRQTEADRDFAKTGLVETIELKTL